jgi:hypothetical protein
MALEIIGAGFGRSGTESTHFALNTLGFPCYHMIEVLRNQANKSHLDFWRKVANASAGTQFDWSEVFSRYRAALDNPASCVWRELMIAYPEAKVLLTVHPRGADAWYDSTMETIYFTESKWQFKVQKIFTRFGRKFGDMAHKLIWQRSLRGTMGHRAQAVARYNEHIEDVKATVPADKLLVFSVDQGWEPLCKFLGVPVPDKPFPRLNDRETFQKNIANMMRASYAILAGLAVVCAGLIYGVWRIVG